MASSKVDALKADIEEINKLLALATRSRVKDFLSLEVRRLETQLITLNEQAKNEGSSAAASQPTASRPAPRCYDVKVTNYAWDQSDKFVKLFITVKGAHTSDKISCQFDKRGVEMKVAELDGKNYKFTLSNLCELLDTDKSHWKVKTDMVVVYLAKASPNQTWKHLTLAEKKAKEPAIPDIGGADDDPQDKIMQMMKKMYEEGDSDMKRTIAKAWSESRDKQTAF